MRKLLLIIPPTLEMGELGKKMRAQASTIPYGVLSIVSYVKQYATKEVDIKILDLNIYPYNQYHGEAIQEQVKQEIRDYQPQLVGLSVMFNHMYPYISFLSKAIKSVDPNIYIFAGGCCTMAYYKEILEECDTVDAISYSEGEIPTLKLMETEDISKFLLEYPAFLTKEGLEAGKQPKAIFVEDLDDIPPIDFDLIPLEYYGVHRTSFRPRKREHEVCLPIVTTRGCPYNCVFCLAGNLHGKKVRKMSADRVIADVKRMKEKYGINVLSIEDDQFLIDKERAKQMLIGLKELDLTLIADSGFTVILLTDEIVSLLSQAGLQTVTLAIESGSDYILHEVIDKPLQLERVAPIVESIRKHNMYCHAFLVVGLPGEKEHHRQETLEFVKKTGIDWCYINCATPIKGSRLYDLCLEKGYIEEHNINFNAFYQCCINTPDFSAEYMTKRAYEMNLELNFVNNYRLRSKDYKSAWLYMKHVYDKYPNHAFAHYFAAQVKKILEENGELKESDMTAEEHMKRFNEIIEQDKEWEEYAKLYGLI